jgi:hypothetical protein
MVSIAAIAGLALAFICVAFIKIGRLDEGRECRVQPRADLPVIGVQIICGDCSGEDVLPIKTYMDRRGRCETCGSKSYILASRRGSEMNRRRAAALQCRPVVDRSAGQEPAKSGRLLAFRTSAGYRRAN